jgi:stage V sporulation protein S
MNLIKVFANSRVFAVVGAIMGVIRDHERAEVYAFGEEAIEQALKAVDLTIVYCKKDEIDIHCVMESADETIYEDVPMAIRLIVEAQS